jgi:hypothetical protein
MIKKNNNKKKKIINNNNNSRPGGDSNISNSKLLQSFNNMKNNSTIQHIMNW